MIINGGGIESFVSMEMIDKLNLKVEKKKTLYNWLGSSIMIDLSTESNA